MQCPDRQELSAYIDGEMTKDSRQMQSHLQQCPQCRDGVLALKEENRMIRDALQGIDLPADLGAYVQNRLKQRERSWWTLKVGVPALLLISGLLALAGNWIPLIEWFSSVLQFMLGGNLAMHLLIFLGRFLTIAAQHVLQGEPVGMIPTFIVLLACLAGILVQIRKGGYDNA
ncbi:MAG: zf-HC2 domain-containing protein [Syntrophomonas sp.]